MFRCMDAATRKCYSQRGGRPGAFGARASAVGAKSGRNGKLWGGALGPVFHNMHIMNLAGWRGKDSTRERSKGLADEK